MQISRHWRLNPQRYRLQGVRYENGTVSLQARPNPPESYGGSKEGGSHLSTEEKFAQERQAYLRRLRPAV